MPIRNFIPQKILDLKSLVVLLLCFSIVAGLNFAAQPKSRTLQGSVQENDAITRLTRPPSTAGNTKQSASLRIDRANRSPLSGLVNTGRFSSPSSSELKTGTASLGLVQPDAFKSLSANKFDLGADRGSRELILAWERWYHQLSAAIYGRWSQVADVPGHAVVRITVTSNRVLNATMVRSSGNRDFDSGLLQAILSLSGDPGLTFPSKSLRRAVSVESDYIAGTNIDPGYSWIRNDYEKINESY